MITIPKEAGAVEEAAKEAAEEAAEENVKFIGDIRDHIASAGWSLSEARFMLGRLDQDDEASLAAACARTPAEVAGSVTVAREALNAAAAALAQVRKSIAEILPPEAADAADRPADGEEESSRRRGFDRM